MEAVRCAVELQSGMAERNAAVANDRRLEVRIGVNVGDIVEPGGDLFGDGVNIVARLEGLAEPGGIVISGNVRDHVGNRLDRAFEDFGRSRR